MSELATRATLVNLHSAQLLALSDEEPCDEEFSALLRDRVTGSVMPLSPRLLSLIRELSSGDEPVRVEVISGYRSWKLNEMLRKKGRKVASQSQHSQGNAVDFRLDGLSSKQLAERIEKMGWNGGLAFYPGDYDRFVHADVGPKRRWRGR